jgi:rubredoxin
MTFTCPVCGFDGLSEPPWDDELPSDQICPGCGTQFGYDDVCTTVAGREAMWTELRDSWIQGGRAWWSSGRPKPADWPPTTS